MRTVQIVKKVSAKKLGKKQRRRHSIMAFEMVRLDRAADEPLHKQLYRQVRDELVSATFNNNSSRLPSSRELAADLGVSRFTVNVAFSRLHAEGYLQSRIGSGTFVVQPLPETFLSAHSAKAEPHTERPPRLSERDEIFRTSGSENNSISESPGRPVSPLFPPTRRLTNFRSKYGNALEEKS